MGNRLSRKLVRTTNGILLWSRRNAGTLPQNTDVPDAIHLMIADPERKGHYTSLDGRYKIGIVHAGIKTAGSVKSKHGTTSNIYGKFLTWEDLQALDGVCSDKMCGTCLRSLRARIEKAGFPKSEIKEVAKFDRPTAPQAATPAIAATKSTTDQKRSLAMKKSWKRRRAATAAEAVAPAKTTTPKEAVPATVETFFPISKKAMEAGAKQFLRGIRDEIDRLISN